VLVVHWVLHSERPCDFCEIVLFLGLGAFDLNQIQPNPQSIVVQNARALALKRFELPAVNSPPKTAQDEQNQSHRQGDEEEQNIHGGCKQRVCWFRGFCDVRKMQKASSVSLGGLCRVMWVDEGAFFGQL
jgi:hypothetical protein